MRRGVLPMQHGELQIGQAGDNCAKMTAGGRGGPRGSLCCHHRHSDEGE